MTADAHRRDEAESSRPLRRIGLIGDVHQEDEALEEALDFLEARAVDRVLVVGDIADGQGDLDRCVRLLARPGVEVVRGNHDRWVLNDQARDLPHAIPFARVSANTKAFLANLPATRRFESAAGPVLLCHGSGRDDMFPVFPHTQESDLRRQHEAAGVLAEYRIVVSGHSHQRTVRVFGQTTFVNAGTLARGDLPTVGIARIASDDPHDAPPDVSFFDLGDGGRITPAERFALLTGKPMPPMRNGPWRVRVTYQQRGYAFERGIDVKDYGAVFEVVAWDAASARAEGLKAFEAAARAEDVGWVKTIVGVSCNQLDATSTR